MAGFPRDNLGDEEVPSSNLGAPIFARPLRTRPRAALRQMSEVRCAVRTSRGPPVFDHDARAPSRVARTTILAARLGVRDSGRLRFSPFLTMSCSPARLGWPSRGQHHLARRCVGGASSLGRRIEAGQSLHHCGAACAREGCPVGGATLGAWRLGTRLDSPRPSGTARGAGEDTLAGAGADSLRANARVAVYLLPRRGLHHGGRPRGRNTNGTAHSVVRRRAPLQFRGLRRPGSSARVQHQ